MHTWFQNKSSALNAWHAAWGHSAAARDLGPLAGACHAAPRPPFVGTGFGQAAQIHGCIFFFSSPAMDSAFFAALSFLPAFLPFARWKFGPSSLWMNAATMSANFALS